MKKRILAAFAAAAICLTPKAWATGELLGIFSVSATKKVQFSQGNLQAVFASAGNSCTWQFAANQYDYVGYAAANNSITGNGSVSAAGIVDLFGWSTAATYYGINNSSDANDYGGDFVDWGNLAISNGGNIENSGWRTLTRAEWAYLFSNHTFGFATVAGVKGIIIAPDNYTGPAIDSNHRDGQDSFANNTIDVSTWQSTYVPAGVVFLPAAGFRLPWIGQVQENAYYWSSSAVGGDSNNRYAILLGHIDTKFQINVDGGNWPANDGFSVRLVKDEATITTAPTVIQELTYTGSARILVNAGTASGGTMQYSLDGSSWSTSLPSGTNWGTYTVYYKVVGDANHTDNPGGVVTAIIGKAPSYGTTVGPWTFDDVRTGWTGYEGAGTSISFNGLNDSKWFGNTYRYNDTDGCGYAYLGTTIVNSKYAVYSTYTHTETVPAYTRITLVWDYQLTSWSSYLGQTTALYAADNLDSLKALPVDFTEDYTDGSTGSSNFYHLEYLLQQSQWGAETSVHTGRFGFDNRNGSTAADQTSAILLTQVIGDETGVNNYVHNWGGFKDVSSSWTTNYYKHITFNANGGEGSMSVQEIENSGTLTANAFTREGYAFIGWATSPNGSVIYADEAAITATESDKGPVTLYAQWMDAYEAWAAANGITGAWDETSDGVHNVFRYVFGQPTGAFTNPPLIDIAIEGGSAVVITPPVSNTVGFTISVVESSDVAGAVVTRRKPLDATGRTEFPMGSVASRFYRLSATEGDAESDLGVQLWENGPYWAECNVGASAPEEYGYYFWWGDTVGYTNTGSAWISVKDGTEIKFSSSDSTAASTYGKTNSELQDVGDIDATGNLVASHDAAHVHWGGAWRMPTADEIDALTNNCTSTWTTTNGVYGRLVTGKGDYANKSIFLPATGVGSGSSLAQTGSYGYGNYWSSTPDSRWSCSYAWDLHFYYNESSKVSRDYYSRSSGQPVRPVRDAD